MYLSLGKQVEDTDKESNPTPQNMKSAAALLLTCHMNVSPVVGASGQGLRSTCVWCQMRPPFPVGCCTMTDEMMELRRL